MQESTFVLYLNNSSCTHDLPRFISRKFPVDKTKPKSIVFILNVGMDPNKQIFLGRNGKKRSHWTIVHVDTETHVVTYCDSCGWAVTHVAGQFLKSYYLKFG